MPMPAHLARAQALKGLMASGYTKSQAEAVLDKTPRKRGRPPKNGGGEVVAFPGGDGVRPPGRAGALYAKIAAAPEVAFDQRALAAIWEGLFGALRANGQIDPSELFPDLYSCNGWNDGELAQERAIGREMAAQLPVVLAALKVTPDEWARWFASSATVRLIQPQCAPGMGMQPMASNAAPPASMPSGWGTLTGAPLLPPGAR